MSLHEFFLPIVTIGEPTFGKSNFNHLTTDEDLDVILNCMMDLGFEILNFDEIDDTPVVTILFEWDQEVFICKNRVGEAVVTFKEGDDSINPFLISIYL